MSKAKIPILAAAATSGLLFVFSLVLDLTPGLAWQFQVFLALLTLLLLLSLKLPVSYQANLVLAVYSTAIMTLAGETFFEIVSDTDTSIIEALETAARKESVQFDTRTRSEVIIDGRNSGVGLYAKPGRRVVGQIGGETVLPLGAMSLTPIIVCNELGEWFVYQTDEHGFNNPLGIWDQRPLGLVSIGDSFTWGACVAPNNSVPALLRTVYPNSLNLGISGTGTLEQLAVIKEYLGDLRPQTVLWFYFEGNDLEDLTEENQNVSILRSYLESDNRQSLVSKQVELDKILKDDIDSNLAKNLAREAESKKIVAGRPTQWLATLEQTSGNVHKLRRIVYLSQLRTRLVQFITNTNMSPSCEVPEETYALFERVVTEAQRFVDTWDGEFYFIYLPSWARYGDPGRGCPGIRDPLDSHDRVVSIAKLAGLEVIDISDTFQDHPDPLSLFPFRGEAHYNEDGYSLVAETVLENLLSGR